MNSSRPEQLTLPCPLVRAGARTPAIASSWRGEVIVALYEQILRQDRIPRIPKHVLLYLVFRANESNVAWPSQSLIAKQLGYSRQHIIKAVDWLRHHGWIATIPKGKILLYDLSPILTHLSPEVTGTCNRRLHRTSIELATKNKSSEERLDDFKKQVLQKCEGDIPTVAMALDIIIERAQQSGITIASPSYLEVALERFSFDSGQDREEILQRRRRIQ